MPKPTEDVFEIEISRIDIDNNRVRKTFSDMESLRISMDMRGLLQPIVVNKKEDNRYDLIAGHRRLITAQSLKWTRIPAKLLAGLEDVERKELEIEENLQRKNVSWIEEADGILELHKLKRELHMVRRTFPEPWTIRKTAQDMRRSETMVSTAIALAEGAALHPTLRKCKTRDEAHRLLKQIRRGDFSGVNHERLDNFKDSFTYGLPDEEIPKIETGIADCIITDITEYHTKSILEELHRILHPLGYAWLFCPFEEHHNTLQIISSFTSNYSKTPSIYYMSTDSRYQMLLWFSKASNNPPKDTKTLYSHRRDNTALSILEKPRSVLDLLIHKSTKKRNYIIDPLCYGMNFLFECLDQQRNCYAICPRKTLYDRILIRAGDVA